LRPGILLEKANGAPLLISEHILFIGAKPRDLQFRGPFLEMFFALRSDTFVFS
jgi:hypothetical protein